MGADDPGPGGTGTGDSRPSTLGRGVSRPPSLPGDTFVAGSLFLQAFNAWRAAWRTRSEGSFGQHRSSLPSASSLSLFMTLALQQVLPQLSQQAPATLHSATAAS